MNHKCVRKQQLKSAIPGTVAASSTITKLCFISLPKSSPIYSLPLCCARMFFNILVLLQRSFRPDSVPSGWLLRFRGPAAARYDPIRHSPPQTDDTSVPKRPAPLSWTQNCRANGRKWPTGVGILRRPKIDKSVEKDRDRFQIVGGKQVADGRQCVTFEQISDLRGRAAAAQMAQRPGSWKDAQVERTEMDTQQRRIFENRRRFIRCFLDRLIRKCWVQW